MFVFLNRDWILPLANDGLRPTDEKDDSHILVNVELNKFIYVERF